MGPTAFHSTAAQFLCQTRKKTGQALFWLTGLLALATHRAVFVAVKAKGKSLNVDVASIENSLWSMESLIHPPLQALPPALKDILLICNIVLLVHWT